MLKIMTIVGTRPELIKMSRVISCFDKFTNHILVHTGQNYDYELNQIFFEDLEIRKPDFFLDCARSSSAQTIAATIQNTDILISEQKPDAILIYGDTNSCLSVISAKKRQVPIFHMEAGNRCFDQRVPEEINRKIVDHLSDIKLVLTEHARRYLIEEGIKQETIFKTGSHMKEVLNYYLPKIKKIKTLDKLNLKSKNYFLVSLHREENVDTQSNLENIIKSLEAIAEIYDKKIIVSVHPRTKKKLDEFKIKIKNSNVIFSKPFGFFDYINLQINALAIISDSGTITEESSLLNLSAITIREMHERPEGMDEGILIMSGLNKNTVLNSLNFILNNKKKYKDEFNYVIDYEVENVSEKVLKIVFSYIDFVNRTVWHKT